MSIRMQDLPSHDRPRERLMREGAQALSDAELLAIQLGSGVRGSSALVTAQALLAEYGGVSGLGRADVADLIRQGGIGQATACRVVSAFALADRAVGAAVGRIVRSSSDVAEIAAPVLGRLRVERVMLLVLDGRHRLIRAEVIASGGAARCDVPVREVLATVLRHDGVALALAHNHPGGDPTPSAADRQVTRRLQKAAEQTGLRFLDHVVIASGAWRSITALR